MGINDSGQIVGTYPGPSGPSTPFLFQGSTLTNLPNVPGTTDDMPEAINNNGWIIGTAGGLGVLWRPGSTSGSYTVTSLDFTPVGINDKNIVAGLDGELWSVGTGDVNVNLLLPPNSGWALYSIASINNNNDLTGLGSQGAYLLTGVTVHASNISVTIDSSNVVPVTALGPYIPYSDLPLLSVFGGENVQVPVTITNNGPNQATGDGTISFYLSPDPNTLDESVQLTPLYAKSGTVTGQSVDESIDLGNLESLSDTVDLQIPDSDSLQRGNLYKYYLVTQLQAPTIRQGPINASDSNTFEFVGAPEFNQTPFENGTYFKFIQDTLNGKFVLPQSAMADAQSFIGSPIIEGDYRFPYADPAGIATIGVGINLTAMTTNLQQALVKDVRSYYAAHAQVRKYFRDQGFKKLPKSASGVVSILIVLAGRNGSYPFDDNTVDVISSAGDQALFNIAYAVHKSNVVADVGSPTWNGLGASAQTALVDIDYNVKHGLVGEFPTFAQDVIAGDFVKAGFDLVDAARTTQYAGLTRRTEADYQALLTSLPNYRALLIGQ